MKKLFRLTTIVLVLIFTFTLLMACNNTQTTTETTSNNETTSTEETQDLIKVKFLLDWTPNTNHTGVYAASYLGYYEEAGLDVEIIQPGESSALSLVASGRADFCVTFQEEIAAALSTENPLPVITVATLLQHNTSGIISLADKNITSPADMEGHSYATWDTPIEKAILSTIIEQDGGDYGKVEMIPNTVMDVVAALQTDIDMVWIYYGWDGIAAELAGLETNFIDFGKTDSVLDFYTPVLASSEDYLKENSETAAKFLEATAKGYEFAIENPEAAAEYLLAQAPELDPDLVAASQKWLTEHYKAEVQQWGYIDQSRWDSFMDWMFENELIGRKLEPGEGFTNEYLGD